MKCRPKKDLLKRIEYEAKKLSGETISMANSSDPYPPCEAGLNLTRKCLQILSRCDCKIQIVTKSNLVTRDTDILAETHCAVALTITTEDEQTARLIEPNAPSPSERLKAIEILVGKDIPVSVRIDPVIPFINENPKRLIAILASIGVKHVTSSTYKVKRDNWQRLTEALPSVAETLKSLYFVKGEKVSGSILLPTDLRLKLMIQIRSAAIINGLKFGVCRENLAHLNTAPCDGSWLLQE